MMTCDLQAPRPKLILSRLNVMPLIDIRIAIRRRTPDGQTSRSEVKHESS
jgi:hypothetical protein